MEHWAGTPSTRREGPGASDLRGGPQEAGEGVPGVVSGCPAGLGKCLTPGGVESTGVIPARHAGVSVPTGLASGGPDHPVSWSHAFLLY